MKRRRNLFQLRLPATVLALLGLMLLGGAATARADAGYTPGSTGASISWAQCGSDFPSPPPQTFAIIAVTGGRAFYQNACLVGEYHWAQSGSQAPSLYLNLNAPAGTTAFEGLSGPKGVCATGDQACQAYNYGYNTAQSAFADAQSQSTPAANWWLDVETGNTWSKNTDLNDQTIQGAIDFLRSKGVSVGIYSTASQWQQIAGAFSPGLPVWAAGASDAGSAPGYCGADRAFGGGSVMLVQYPGSGDDSVYVCGAPPAVNTPAAPAAVTATALNPTTIQVNWTEAAPAAESFAVTDPNGIVGNVPGNATTLTVTNLAPGSYHCYAVTAQSSGGYTPWSAWACTTTPQT